MPATSKAQANLFKLVRAVQKGDVPANRVTQNVRQMAKDTSPKDASDMSKPEKNAPKRVIPKSSDDEKNEVTAMTSPVQQTPDITNIPQYEAPQEPAGLNFFEIVGRYNEYGKVLKMEHSLSELAQQLGSIAEYAEYALTNETDDWYDAGVVRRHLKEMQGYAKEFAKIATEADSHMAQMSALYEDMGHILQRYFEIYDTQQSNPAPQMMEIGTDEVVGDEGDKQYPRAQFKTNSEYDKPEAERKVDEVDPITERAINIARSRLKEADIPSFNSLPMGKQAMVAWKMISETGNMAEAPIKKTKTSYAYAKGPAGKIRVSKSSPYAKKRILPRDTQNWDDEDEKDYASGRGEIG